MNCIDCKNGYCFIKHCLPKWADTVNGKKRQILCKKFQRIFREGSPVHGVYFIQDGKVKVTSSNLSGKEQIVRLATDGHILGHRGVENENYPIGATALETSKICFLDNQTLHTLFMSNPEFTYQIMMFYSYELRKSEQRIKYFAQMTVDERVNYAILYLVEIFGYNEADKSVNACLSRQEIADIAGTNSEQVSRTISFLKQKKVISTQGKKIFIEDFEGLKSGANRYIKTHF